MSIDQDIRPISWLKARTAQALDQVNHNQRAVIITQKGKARAVLQDVKSYEDMQETLGILKLIAQGEQEFREGKGVPQETVFRNLRSRISKRKHP